MGRTKKLLCAVAVCATAVVGVGASAAYAGEVTGPSGSDGRTDAEFHAHSACVFSGLNDDPNAPLTEAGNGNGPGGQAQSYGQDVKLGIYSPNGPNRFNPASSFACNPTRQP
jgi:hypothetical protein